MILCPGCKTSLVQAHEEWQCPNCGYRALIHDTIVEFHPDISHHDDYRPEDLSLLNSAEEKHFWFRSRRIFIAKLLKKQLAENSSLLEIGAGTGDIAKMLSEMDFEVSVNDLYSSGLRYASGKGLQRLYQFDLAAPPFREHFDAVTLFDVIEHIEDDLSAVKNAASMVKPGGLIIVTVPAHPSLWCSEDRDAGHKRRYTLKTIKALFDNAGLVILEARHFFSAVMPLLYIRKLAGLIHPDSKNKKNEIRINPLINSILYSTTIAEFFLTQRAAPRFGGSIACVAQKSTGEGIKP